MSFENRAFYRNVDKHDRARQATDDNLMQRWEDAICMLCSIHQRNDADRMYLSYCPVRAWIQLRYLEGMKECDGYAV
jgi:hypothetical protein